MRKEGETPAVRVDGRSGFSGAEGDTEAWSSSPGGRRQDRRTGGRKGEPEEGARRTVGVPMNHR